MTSYRATSCLKGHVVGLRHIPHHLPGWQNAKFEAQHDPGGPGGAMHRLHSSLLACINRKSRNLPDKIRVQSLEFRAHLLPGLPAVDHTLIHRGLRAPGIHRPCDYSQDALEVLDVSLSGMSGHRVPPLPMRSGGTPMQSFKPCHRK